jgi:hypothetical protein
LTRRVKAAMITPTRAATRIIIEYSFQMVFVEAALEFVDMFAGALLKAVSRNARAWGYGRTVIARP